MKTEQIERKIVREYWYGAPIKWLAYWYDADEDYVSSLIEAADVDEDERQQNIEKRDAYIEEVVEICRKWKAVTAIRPTPKGLVFKRPYDVVLRHRRMELLRRESVDWFQANWGHIFRVLRKAKLEPQAWVWLEYYVDGVESEEYSTITCKRYRRMASRHMRKVAEAQGDSEWIAHLNVLIHSHFRNSKPHRFVEKSKQYFKETL